MPDIAILPPELVNRIAAGECVERPASVVKELVENALDAGAGRIDILIEDGGRELIQITDDGRGMAPDDLLLSIQPHATSKIRTDDDLFDIRTMGFRGEALPSIGSVSRLAITSRPRGSDVAHTIRVDAGKVADPTPVGAPLGTTVEVRDLFYCVPARRKFLKTNPTEMGHITEQLARLALAHPQVAFSLRHGKRLVHQLAATDDPRQRIGDFYGHDLAEVLLPVRREGQGVRVEGWVTPPKETRGSGKWEYVFVNGRYVRDKFVSHAIKAAYRSLIDPQRYPVAFLFITIAADAIDVNVHPTKIEVRWRDSNYIHSQVLAALRDKFLATNLDHTLQTPAGEAQYKERVRQAMVDFFQKGSEGSRVQGAEGKNRDQGVAAGPRTGRAFDVASGPRAGRAFDVASGPRAGRGYGDVPSSSDHYESQQPYPTNNEQTVTGNEAHSADNATASDSVPAFPRSRVPAAPDANNAEAAEELPPTAALQVHNMYIVAQTADGLMIVDQHALHERILYEELKTRIAERPLESQRLLLPEVVSVPPDRIEALETHADLLARVGIELTPSGPASVTLHAFPSLLERVNRERFVRDLLDSLADTGSRPTPEMLVHDLLDMMACKAAVKFGDPLTHEEIEALLARRQQAERTSHCPHGRPTTLHLTLRDLERQFKRR